LTGGSNFLCRRLIHYTGSTGNLKSGQLKIIGTCSLFQPKFFLFLTSYHLTFYSLNMASLFFNWFILWLKNDPLYYLELMQMYLSIYFQLSLLPKLVESTFLRKLHDLSNNEAAPDSTRLVPTGLDTDFSCQSTTTSHTLWRNIERDKSANDIGHYLERTIGLVVAWFRIHPAVRTLQEFLIWLLETYRQPRRLKTAHKGNQWW
jgi:hypothetical protein